MRDVAAIQADMEEVVSFARTEGRGLTDDEITKYEGLEGELQSVRKGDELFARHDAYMTPVIGGRPDDGKPKESEEMRAFSAYLRTGIPNMGLTPGKAEEFAQSTTTTGGGYTIPDEAMRPIIDVRKAYGGIRSVAEVIQTSTGAPLPWPTIDDTANTGEVVAEGSTIASGDDLVFGTGSLGAFTYMSGGASNLPLRVPKALLQDSSVDINELVIRKLGMRINRQQAAEFAQGDGSGNPKGLFYKAATVQTASGGAITHTALLDLLHSVDPEYRASASWIFNDGTLKLIRQVLDGNDRPIYWDSASSLSSAPGGGILMGYPVVIDQGSPNWSATATDDVPAGTGSPNEGYISFGDHREGFVIRDVAGVEVIVDPYGRAGYGEVQYFAIARADATQQNNSAYHLLQGYHA